METSSAHHALGGMISSISLTSFIQMLAWEKNDSTITISASEGKGWLYVQNGELIDAEDGKVSGLEAVYNLCSWKNPTLGITPFTNRPRRIDLPVSQILLEASRQHDEQATPVDHHVSSASAQADNQATSHQDYAGEIQLLMQLPEVIQCAITDKKGTIVAQSVSSLKFESILRYSVLAGIEMQNVLECKEQEYTSISTSDPGILFLIPERNRILCIQLKKDTSPAPMIMKIKQQLRA